MGSKRKITSNDNTIARTRKRRGARGDDLQAEPAEVDGVRNVEKPSTDLRENMADVARR
jgi:hypothetical protein